MKNLFILLLELFFISYWAEASPLFDAVERPNLFTLSPKAQHIGAYDFPRNGHTQCRGTSSKFLTLETAIMGLFRDKTKGEWSRGVLLF